MKVACLALLSLLLGACALLPDAARDTAALDRMRDDPSRMLIVAVANPPEARTLHASSTPRGYDLIPAYDTGGSARARLETVMHDYHLRRVAGWPIQPLGLDCVVLQVADGDSRESVLAALTQDWRVALAQPLHSFDTLSSGLSHRYNDPYVELQTGLAQIGATAAQRSARGAGVRLALIDTGVAVDHPDLAGRIGSVRDFVNGDAQAFRRERHGTEVAGVIAAVANNGQGIVGVAPEVRLSVLRACWQLQAPAQGARCNSFTLAQALAAAIADGAQVVNLSLGGPPDLLLTRLVAYGQKKGMVFVGAVAPDGAMNRFPVDIPGVIAVDTPEARGAVTAVLRAPGAEVLSLEPEGRYGYSSGSSLSTAYVSAAVALLLGERSGLDGARLAALLAPRNAAPGGVIDVCAALVSLRGTGDCQES